MGEYKNTRWQNIANWSIVAFVIVVSTIYGISVLVDPNPELTAGRPHAHSP